MAQGKAKLSMPRCPGGHKLPRQGCTPMYCLESRAGAKAGGRPAQPQTAARRDAINKAMAVPLQDLGAVAATNTGAESLEPAQREGQALEATKLAIAAGKLTARRGLLPVPEGLKGGDAEEYAQKKLVDMLPQAVTELEHQLTYGDDKQRIDAARDVLDANGMRRREMAGNMVPPIVLNFNGVLPWMQQEKTLNPTGDAATMEKVKARAQIIDGEASRSKDGESGSDGDGPRGSAQAHGRGGQGT